MQRLTRRLARLNIVWRVNRGVRHMPHHSPQRTCVGCRAVDAPERLVRVVIAHADAGLRIVVDHSRHAHGRGAWVHPAASCIETALSRGGFRRSFKTAVDTSGLERELGELSHPTRGNESRVKAG